MTASTDDVAMTGSLAGEGLTFAYDAGRPVLQDLSLDIPAGRVTALIGANGSGKTTLLKLLGRQLRPDAGRVTLDGRDLGELRRHELAIAVAFLFQENAAPQGLSVEELAMYGRFPFRRLFEGPSLTDIAAVERALEQTGLTSLRHRPVDQLSGGQRQLAWVGLALAQTARVLLLDEPTTFLDLLHGVEVLRVVERLRADSGMTIVMVLHDVNQAARHADHIVALRGGRVVAQGRPADVLTAAVLCEVYGVEAEVLQASDGLPVCVVRGPSAAPTTLCQSKESQ